MERLSNVGIILKRPYLADRVRVSRDSVSNLNPTQAEIKFVDLNTSKPEGFIFEKQINDQEKGIQKIRVVKTTKPYNPDFINSAQTLIYIFPDNPSQAITTPIDGDKDTWLEFLNINREVVNTIAGIYEKKGIGNLVVSVGINFSPYSNADFLRTQTIKAAHIHTFLISQKLLDQVSFFSSRRELRDAHTHSTTPKSDISRDLRRFFTGPINQLFSAVVLSYIERNLNTVDLGKLSKGTIFNNPPGHYPLNGIIFTSKGSESLNSPEYFEMIKTSYKAVEDFYSKFIMPVLSSNYQKIVSSDFPETNRLEYNTPQTALSIFDEKISMLQDITDIEKKGLRKLTQRLARRLNKDKLEVFALGPALTYTTIYEPKSDLVKNYIVCNPFGGGSVESIGIDKIPITDSEQNKLLKKFNSKRSVNMEHKLDEALKKRLSNL